MKTTLKELCQGGGEFDATPSAFMNFVGTVSQGRRWWPIRHGLPAGAETPTLG